MSISAAFALQPALPLLPRGGGAALMVLERSVVSGRVWVFAIWVNAAQLYL
jgi:hypothetical protein